MNEQGADCGLAKWKDKKEKQNKTKQARGEDEGKKAILMVELAI